MYIYIYIYVYTYAYLYVLGWLRLGFRTASGRAGSSRECRNSPSSTFMGKCDNMWQNVGTCGNMCALKADSLQNTWDLWPFWGNNAT